MLEGPATHYFMSGAMFHGSYKAGKRHGSGLTVLPCGTSERATWENGKEVGLIKVKTPGGWLGCKNPHTGMTSKWVNSAPV